MRDPHYDDRGTNQKIMAHVREVLGTIDLDPASTEVANRIVEASRFYTKADDGLSKPWNGKVFLNPPWSSPLLGKFLTKLTLEFVSGNVEEFICLTQLKTDTRWSKRLQRFVWAIGTQREAFANHLGEFDELDNGDLAVLRSPLLYTYGGPRISRFIEIFDSPDTIAFVPNKWVK